MRSTFFLALFFSFNSFAQKTWNGKKTITINDVKDTTLVYKARVLSTNFALPLIRFNLQNKESSNLTKAYGDVTFFNSIGAGINYSWGRLEESRNSKGEIVNTEFNNTFGFQLGFLFSAKTGDNPTNVFAPMIGFNLLNFQIGLGHELGTITENQKRTFFTIAYSIPLSKLFKGGFWIHKKNKLPINEFEEGFEYKGFGGIR